MSDINNIILNNKIDKISKNINNINSDIINIEQDIIDLQSNSGGVPSLKDKYLYQNDFIITTPQSITSSVDNWLVNGSGVGFDGLTDYDNINGIRGCRRIHANLNTSSYSYISFSQTPIKPNSFTKYTMELKMQVDSVAMGSNSCKVILGFTDNPLNALITKYCNFRIHCTNTARTFATEHGNTVFGLSPLNNLQFYKLKIVVDRLNSVNFYVNDVLVNSYNTVNTTFNYFPMISINELVVFTNQPSAFVWVDWYELSIEYDAGNR